MEARRLCIFALLTFCLLLTSFAEERSKAKKRLKRAVTNLSNKPKIVTTDGHLAIQSAANHNISLITDDKGDVNLGGTSIKSMLNTIKTLSNQVNTLKQQISQCCGNPCVSDATGSLCGTNGACIPASASSTNGTGYRCVCDAGYKGVKCDQKTTGDPCGNVMCLNGGTCMNQHGVPECKCTSGFFGPRCSRQRPTNCNKNYNSEQGTISSVGYPDAYPASIDCTYVIRTTPGKIVVLSFVGISIQNSPGCSKDSIEVRDGASSNSRLLNTFCGSNLPGQITSTTNEIYIRFKTDASVQIGSGFSLYYFTQVSATCGGSLTSDSGSIASPSWPQAYNKAATCVWVVSMPSTERVSYEIGQLVITGSASACNSYLELHNGPSDSSPIIGKYCSNAVLPKDVTTGNQLYIKFVTDGTGSLFKMKYTTPCGGNLTTSSGVIQSPYFPNFYPHKKRCVWTISVPRGNIITLRFPNFDIERSSNCMYDYLAVTNGPSTTDPLIGRYCGSTPPTAVTSSMNEMTLIFRTDGSDSFRGFRASYTSAPGGCGGAVTGSSGNISSPTSASSYPHSVRCIWTITASDRSRSIQLYFLSFHLEEDTWCRYDYVTFRDGALSTSPVLYNNTRGGRFCGTRKPPVITSSGESLTVAFITDVSIAKVGFSAKWMSVPRTSGCDVFLSTPSGSIQSPGYPNNYPHRQNCKYTISISSGMQIALVFRVFQIEQHSSCNYDYLMIYDGVNNTSPMIGKFCGTHSPGRIVSRGNSLHLVFRSDFSSSAKGFFANYTTGTSVCGGVLHAASGFIRSPNYPNPYRHNAVCEWIIHVEDGNTVTANVTDLSIESSTGCRYDNVELRDGSNSSTRLITRLCGTQRPTVIFKSTGSFLFVRFRSDTSVAGRGFEISYKSGCGGVYRALRGVLMSPNYPSNYPNRKTCNYTVIGNTGDKIRLTFTDFRLESHSTCRHDKLNIYNGSSLSAPQIGSYCGSRVVPFNVSSTVSSLFMQFISDSSLAYRGFRAIYEIIGCSGMYTAENGTFATPNYPSSYPINRMCKFRIKVAPGRRIQLNFSEIDVETHTTCRFDYVEIYNGNDETAPLIQRYCSRHAAISLTSSSNEVLVKFRSDSSNTGRGFRATYTSMAGGCGGVFRASSGYIFSPNYPQNYPTRVQCEWVIIVQPQHNVRLNFVDFLLESHQSCAYDYVQVRDGYGVNATELAKGCANRTIGLVVSTGNVMIVKFRSDATVTARGFKALFTTGCGGTVNADTPGAITSPNYPNNYPHLANCVWVLRGTPGRKVTLTFTNFDIEQHTACNYDYVEVRQGDNANSTLVGKFCGSNVPSAITSFGNSLYVRFFSDQSSSARGFRAQYTTETAACGGTFTAINGSFTSPLYPARTPTTADCAWKLQVSPGSVVSLSFTNFNLLSSSSCSSAYVEVRDGSSQSSNLIGRYCGTSLPPTVSSTKENMYVRFYHSASTTSAGFKAIFGAVCDNTITYTQGYITSPRWPLNYPNRQSCTWKIVLVPGRRIAVRFTDFDLEDHSTCRYDYLEARNGNSPTSPLVGRYCGTQAPSPFSSSSNLLYLKFNSDSSVNGRGFRLYFDGGPAGGCGGVFTASNQQQYITSPNYPSNYANNAVCTWVINAPNGHSIKANFTDFQLERGFGGCNTDYVELRDGATSADTLIRRYCGTLNTFAVYSHGSSLYIRFRTDGSVVRKGFRLGYQMSCGGELTATTGIIRPPTVNNQYLPNQNCTWQISVTSGTSVRVSFSSFNIESSASCSNDYVLIRNGIAADSPVLARLCGSSIPAVIMSTNSKISVQFVTNGAVQAAGFLLNYTQFIRGCGGSLSINDPVVIGNLTSPNYPNHYPVNTECVWTLNVPTGDNVEFTFVDLDIESHSRCVWDYVELRDGGSVSSPSLGRFCGSSLPNIRRYVSSGSQLVIKLRSDTSITGRGFTASWKIGCGKAYFSASGTILSPRFPSSYPPNRDCIYTIQIPERKQIQVDFNVFGLASSSGCNSDFLEIHDGLNASSALIGKYCGTRLPASFVSDGRNLYMRFKSDASTSGNGFRATYQTVGAACGGSLYGTTGTFTSPGYPRAYPRSRTCTWIITVARSHSVQLRLTALNIQNSASCTQDYLEVRDGDSASSPLIKRYCGTTIPPVISSSGTKMYVKFFSNSDTVQLSGFSATYTSFLPGCGGRLLSSSGNITSPNYPSNYPSRVECTWVLTVPTGMISIIFSQFLIEDHSMCNYDFVEIRDGDSNLAPLVGKICGSKGLGFNYTSFGRSLFVKFRSDSSVTSRGFLATWGNSGSAGGQCGGVLPAKSGIITTPRYPSNYPANLMCLWKMQATAGHQITSTYLDMQIETSNRCAKDYVSLLNGALSTSPVLSKLCSSALPAVTTFKSTGNSMVMSFKSDASGSGRGVKLIYNQTLIGCGGVYTATKGTIVSPGYPNGHLHNLECIWTINVPSAGRIELYFNDFGMELASKCQYDYLEVRDGATQNAAVLATLCGPSIPQPVTSSGNTLYLRFRTDATTALKGFNLTYTTECGGTIKSRTGVISSPGYPSVYPPSKDCEWKVQVRSHYRLELSFTSFSLPAASSSGCSDYLQIRNGTDSTSPSLGKYCGTRLPAPVSSMSNSMYLKFHSDASTNLYHGFQASYKAVCGGTITDTAGVISSTSLPSGSYHHDEKCTWLIRFPAGQRVSVKFISFRMEYSSRCQYDYVEIRDGTTANAPVIGRFCGSVVPPSFISSGNTLNVTFVTDGSLNYDGFSLSYSSAPPSCGGDFSAAGTIRMPKTSGNYSHNEACGWAIRAPAGQKIRITFTSFNLEKPMRNRCYDFVEIREGPYPTSPLYGRYCGTKGPGSLTSTGQSLFIRFHSDATINATGFAASFQFVQGCGARLTATSTGKVLTSQNYPSNYPPNSRCEWLISARDGYKVQISFTDFQLPPAVNGKCPSNSLIIRNGPTRSSPVNNRIYCGNMKIPNYISDSNIIRVTLNSTVAAKGFSATYKEGVCGGAYTANNGLVTSPNYPSLHPLSIECTYTITVVAGSRIQLYFRDFDIEGSGNANCQYDFLDIRDGSTSAATQIGSRSWCGIVPPPSIMSSGNTLYMRFKTDASVQKSGFAISYTSTNRGCGGDLSSTMGAVTSPKYPTGYNDTYDCTWKISVTVGKKVKLTFKDFHLPYQASCVTTDFVEVRNGPLSSSGLVGQYCGSLIPAQFNSTSNQVYIRFKSTARSVLYSGFKAFFDEVM